MKLSISIISEAHRERALAALRSVPLDPLHVIEIKEKKETRSGIQNRRMWAMLSDISRQVNWHSQKLTKENWKDVFTAALKRQQVVPGLEGGFVVLGTSTSRMSVAEMCEMTDLMFAFGAEHKVYWTDPTLPQEE